MNAGATNHHLWKAGDKLGDFYGHSFKLLAPTWNGWAWVLPEYSDVPIVSQVEYLMLKSDMTNVHASSL